MRWHRPAAAAVLAALAAGCAVAEPRYAKPGATDAQAAEELASCRADTQEAMAQGRNERRAQADTVELCMQAKGYARADRQR